MLLYLQKKMEIVC